MMSTSHARLVPPSAKYIGNASMHLPSTVGSHSTLTVSQRVVARNTAVDLRLAIGEHDAMCNPVKINWLTVTSPMHMYNAMAYVRLNPATRR
jgi:hypothetical protein